MGKESGVKEVKIRPGESLKTPYVSGAKEKGLKICIEGSNIVIVFRWE